MNFKDPSQMHIGGQKYMNDKFKVDNIVEIAAYRDRRCRQHEYIKKGKIMRRKKTANYMH